MDYPQLRRLYRNRNAVFARHNGADATGNDGSTDAVITRDPNNFLVPKINGFTVVNSLQIAVLILGLIILLPLAFKTLKTAL